LDSPIRELIERVMGDREYNLDRCIYLYKKYVKPSKSGLVTISDGRIVSQKFNKDVSVVARRFKEVMGDNVRFVVVLRNQEDYVKSKYIQHVGTKGVRENIDTWFADNWRAGEMLSSELNYNSRISPYIEYFGKENVGIFLYEELKENLDEFEKKLCKFLGIKSGLLSSKGRGDDPVNKRMTKLHYILLQNKTMSFFAKKLSEFLPKKFYKYIFSKFSRAEPRLSEENLITLQELASKTNTSLSDKNQATLKRYGYFMN